MEEWSVNQFITFYLAKFWIQVVLDFDAVNLYCAGIGDINPIVWGCHLNFNSRIYYVVVCYCDAWPDGLLVICDEWSIKVKVISELFGFLTLFKQWNDHCIAKFLAGSSRCQCIIADHSKSEFVYQSYIYMVNLDCKISGTSYFSEYFFASISR